MEKGKLLAIVLFVLGLCCFGAYFVLGGPTEFTVTFNSVGGSKVEAQKVKSGEKATKPADPTREDGTFIEWQLDGAKYDFDKPVEKNITLYANWNLVKEFNVEVKLEDKDYTATVTEGETLKLESLNIPEKEGYRVNLYTEDEKVFDLTTKITEDLKLTAKYVEIKTYTVTFNSNGGSKVETQKVENESKATEPTSTRDGYDLDGWYLNDKKFDFTTPITKNITLKAKWTEKGKISVIFTVDDKEYKKVSVKEGQKVSKPSNPTKKGYKFVEWQLNDTAFDFNTKITEPTTLVAKFEEAQTYTVSFNSDGGSTVKAQDVEVGSKATKPTDPTKKGYVFKEWQLNGKTYDFSKVVEGDIALKAVWEVEKPKFTVKFDSNGGSEVKSQTVEEGTAITKPTDPSKDNFIFDEWLLNNKTFDFKTVITKDMVDANNTITLVARYRSPSKFTVAFNTGNGSAVSSKEVYEGGKAVRPATNPTLEGSKFVEWQLDGKTYDFNNKVTKNITLTAKWETVTPSPSATPTANPDVSTQE